MKLLSYFILIFALVISGCSAIAPAAPTPIPTIVLEGGSVPASASGTTSQPQSIAGGVRAAGVIEPFRQVTLSAATSGQVIELQAVRGEQVEAGAILLTLSGAGRLDAAVAAAELERLSAIQALEALKTNAKLTLGQAQLRLATALDELDKAEKRRLSKEFRVGSDTQVNLAQADLIMAKDTLKKTEDMYAWVKDNPDDNIDKANALSALSAARLAYDKATANLNYVLSIPNPIEVAKADAALTLAKAEAEAAQTALDKLVNGVDPETLALAEARLRSAESQLQVAKLALEDLIVKAPFAGTVLSVNAVLGESVLPGAPVLVLADLSQMRVRTTDLSERDVAAVSVGQPVQVLVKALDLTLPGTVSEIATSAETLGGDVVYPVWVTLDELPAGLKAGMSVDVTFGK